MLATSFYSTFPFQYLPQHPSASGMDFPPHHFGHRGAPFGGPPFARGRPTLRGGFNGVQTPLGSPPPGFGFGRGTFGLGFHIGNDFDDHHQHPFRGGRCGHPNDRGRGGGRFRGHAMHHPGRAFTEDFMFARPGFDVPTREHLESSGSESSGSFSSGEVNDGDENRPSKNPVREDLHPSAHGKHHHHHGRHTTRGLGRKGCKINMSKEQASEALPTSGEPAPHNDELRDETRSRRCPFERRAGLHHHRHHYHHHPYNGRVGTFRGGPIRGRGMRGLGRSRGGACQLCFFLEETDSETETINDENDERPADSNVTRDEQNNNEAIQIDDNDSESVELVEHLSPTNTIAEDKEKVDEDKVEAKEN